MTKSKITKAEDIFLACLGAFMLAVILSVVVWVLTIYTEIGGLWLCALIVLAGFLYYARQYFLPIQSFNNN